MRLRILPRALLDPMLLQDPIDASADLLRRRKQLAGQIQGVFLFDRFHDEPRGNEPCAAASARVSGVAAQLSALYRTDAERYKANLWK